MSTLLIHTDGGARGNPGPAAIGVVFGAGEFHETHKRCIGETTNNVAEYTAVLDALEKVPALIQEHGIDQLHFHLDSELVVRQIEGKYKVKEPTLQKLHQQVHLLLHQLGLPYTFTHVPRADNAQADKLVNQALDSAS